MDIPAKKIEELALHDPQVSAAMRYYLDDSLTWTEMLERLVLVLVDTKHTLNKELTRVMALHGARLFPPLYCPCACHKGHHVDVRYCTVCAIHNPATGKLWQTN